VTNLIDNAVRHNIPGGYVRVVTGTRGDRAFLSVVNSGKYIPPAVIDRLFQPFQRFGPRIALSNNGHGIGLAIVHGIVAAHRASITAQPQGDGGLSIDVTFPPALSSPPVRVYRSAGQAISLTQRNEASCTSLTRAATPHP